TPIEELWRANHLVQMPQPVRFYEGDVVFQQVVIVSDVAGLAKVLIQVKNLAQRPEHEREVVVTISCGLERKCIQLVFSCSGPAVSIEPRSRVDSSSIGSGSPRKGIDSPSIRTVG